MFPIYLITCSHPRYAPNLMPYVGVVLTEGKTVEERFNEHFYSRTRSNAKYLHRAIKKYGREWFQVEQIDAGNTPEQALELEAWWIKCLGTRAPDGGYNLTEGGKGVVGHTHSSITRQKMSEAASNSVPDASWSNLKPGTEVLHEWRKTHPGPNKGRKFSAEWIANNVAAHRRKKS